MTASRDLPPETGRDNRWRSGLVTAVLVLLAIFLDYMLSANFGFDPVPTRDGAEVPPWLIAVIIVLSSAFLILRRSRPMLAMIVIAGTALVLPVWVEHAQPMLGSFFALYAVAARRPRGLSLAALALTLMVTVNVSFVVSRSFPDPDLLDYAFPLVVFSVIAATLWVSGRREFTANQRAEVLRSEIDVQAQAAASQERHRIARELHDILAHSVSAMMMQAAAPKQWPAPC